MILNQMCPKSLYLIYALLSQIQLCRDYVLFGGHFWPKFVERGHKNILKDRGPGATNWTMCIFAAELFSLSVKFFTARDGIVMFSHYFKQFWILVQIAIRSPDLLQNRSRESPDSTWKSFFPPITTYFSTKSRWQNFVTHALHCMWEQCSVSWFSSFIW